MSKPLIVGLSGSLSRPSRTRGLVEAIVAEIASRQVCETVIHDIASMLPALGRATSAASADTPVRDAIAAVTSADVLVVGTPVFKGAYGGLFKHFFDLLDAKALAGRTVVLAATGGSERHALVIQHALIPLFSFFGATTVPTSIYATELDFLDYRPSQAGIIERISRAADEAVRLELRHHAPPAIARSA